MAKIKQKETRLFFVIDSIKDNEEIFERLEEAIYYFQKLGKINKPRLYIAMVKNAYKRAGVWNYDDYSDTFEIVKHLYKN